MPTLNDASFLTQTFKDAWREDYPRYAAPMARDLTGAYPHVCVSPLRDALGAGMLRAAVPLSAPRRSLALWFEVYPPTIRLPKRSLCPSRIYPTKVFLHKEQPQFLWEQAK